VLDEGRLVYLDMNTRSLTGKDVRLELTEDSASEAMKCLRQHQFYVRSKEQAREAKSVEKDSDCSCGKP
jgi:hypothetical protein